MHSAQRQSWLQTTARMILLATILFAGLACRPSPGIGANALSVNESGQEQLTKDPSEKLYLPIAQTAVEVPIELGRLSIFYPREVVANPNNNFVYVISGFGDNNVVVLDGLNIAAEHIIGGPSIHDIEVDTKNNRIDILHEDERLEVLTVLQDAERLYSLEMPFTGVRAGLWHSHEELLYVAGSYRIDEPEVVITRTIAIFSDQELVATLETGDFQSLELSFDPITGHVYAGGAYYEYVEGLTQTTAGMLVYNKQALVAEHRIEKSSRISGIIAHQNGDVLAYTSPISSRDYTDLHLFRNDELIASTLVHGSPYPTLGMASNPSTGDIYLYNVGEVSHLRVEDDRFVNLGKTVIGCCITKAAVDEANGFVYLINFQGNQVVVLDGGSLEKIADFDIYAPFHLSINPATGIAYISSPERSTLTLIGVPSAIDFLE